MEIQRFIGDGIGIASSRVQQTRSVTSPAVRPVAALRCRYCHQERPAGELHRCELCGARVCDSCGGIQANPTGFGEYCMGCARATEAWHERWHLQGRGSNYLATTGADGFAGD